MPARESLAAGATRGRPSPQGQALCLPERYNKKPPLRKQRRL